MSASTSDARAMAALYKTFSEGTNNDATSVLSYLDVAGIKLEDSVAAAADQVKQSDMPSLKSLLENRTPVRALAANNASEECSVETYWWGFDIKMNDKLTDDICTGTISAGALGTTIATALTAGSIITGPIGAAIAAGFATAFGLKVAEIKIVNNGNGVHWPVSWPQLGLVVASVSMGPLSVLAAVLAFIHPGRN